jgi:NAD(P)-dependent dehydrogenase (short-subunit alcohol dehydrogenase family)
MAKGHKDKVAVITGAANGIGQAFAKRLAEDGVHIAIADIAPANETVTMVEQAGRQALACQCDVASEVAAMAAKVQKKFGRCDIVINSAGIFPQLAFDQMKFADWRRVLSINLDSVFLVSSAFVPGMKQRGWGRRQHGVEHLRLGDDRLRALCHQQGRHHGFHAGAGERAWPARHHRQRHRAKSDANARRIGAKAARAGIASIDEEFELVAQGQSIKRVELPEDLVGTVSYLTSDDAAFVTGQMINVNGGRIFS